VVIVVQVGAAPEPADARSCPDVPAEPVNLSPVVMLGLESVGVFIVGEDIAPVTVKFVVTVKLLPTVTLPLVSRTRLFVAEAESLTMEAWIVPDMFASYVDDSIRVKVMA
jgi:hypothetical protein